MLKDYEHVLDLRKEDVLKELDSVRCVWELISFRSNLVVT
jgi:hypothetical protein